VTILTVAEHRRGELRPVSFEAITAGRELADALDTGLHVAAIGTASGFAEELNRAGVDVIHAVAEGKEFNHDVYTQVIDSLASDLDPRIVLMPNSVNGLDYAPAVANGLSLPLVTDVIGFEAGETITAIREMYGSKVETTIEIDADRFCVTIRPNEWAKTEEAGDAKVRERDIEIDESRVRSTVTGFQEVGGGDVDISDAEVLVSVGRGIDEEENIELVEELADALGATLSSSRPIVDAGWLPKNRQVGQSGKVVTPDVYLAIGISGAVQHVAGMKGADTIVAINTDPNAPIFDLADYGIVDDLFEVVPELTAQFS
jgi:electron transfer flavoprotein alpha subunit